MLFATFFFFFFNDTATTEIYTLSLHDALPISGDSESSTDPTEAGYDEAVERGIPFSAEENIRAENSADPVRSEEHTSELQSQSNLVCRLLLEKKKKNMNLHNHATRLSRADACA